MARKKAETHVVTTASVGRNGKVLLSDRVVAGVAPQKRATHGNGVAVGSHAAASAVKREPKAKVEGKEVDRHTGAVVDRVVPRDQSGRFKFREDSNR